MYLCSKFYKFLEKKVLKQLKVISSLVSTKVSLITVYGKESNLDKHYSKK